MHLRRSLAVIVSLLLVAIGALTNPGVVAAAGSEYGAWTVSGANPSWTGTMTIAATGFPAATFSTDSNTPGTPTSATLGTGTPFGARFGSSSGKQYLSFRSGSGGTSTTTFGFAAPTPASGWGFALGDVDAESIRVSGVGPQGPLTAAQLGWQGAFNYSGEADQPTWDASTSTLIGNGVDTNGASGWFMPTVPITTLTFTFTNLVGFPIAQLWMAANTRDLGGTVALDGGGDIPAGTTVELFNGAGVKIATEAVAAGGAFSFDEVAAQVSTVKLVAPAGYQVVGSSSQTIPAGITDVTNLAFTIKAGDQNTTLTIANVAPNPSLVAQPYTVSGTVFAATVAPGTTTLPGSVTVTGDGSGCTASSLTLIAGVANTFAFSCAITPTEPGTKKITAAYVDPAGTYGSSAASSAHTTFAAGANIERISGANRIETSAQMARAFFPGGAPVVYVATDRDFADALVAGPPAGIDQGPVLLTTVGSLPASTRAEIRRLRPAQIIIVGGTSAVSNAVAAELAAEAATVTRIGGANRYETAALLVAARMPAAPARVYIATGTSFADALSAGAPAGVQQEPILLATHDSLPAATAAELERLAPSRITVLGGRAAISAPVVEQLGAYASTVSRIEGGDRYGTSAAVVDNAFRTAPIAMLATGTGFADALSAVPAAVVSNGPVLLTRPDCIPPSVAAELRRLAPSRIIIVGGPAAVSNSVAALVECR